MWNRVFHRRRRLILSLLAFGVPFGIYVWTQASTWALNTIYSIDSAEMVIAAQTLGIDHAPGHPLYLLIVHLSTMLPFAQPDGGVILLSAFCGGLATLLLAWTIEAVTGSTIAALGASWSLGFGFIFWIHATIAEVYTLQLVFLGLFTYLAARWLESRDERFVHGLFLTVGLGATSNLLLMVLLLPAMVYLVVRSGALVEHGRWLRSRMIKAVLWGMCGLVPFVYIPIRLAQMSGFVNDMVYSVGYELQSLRWYWWYLSAEEFTSHIFNAPFNLYPALVGEYLQRFAANYSLAAAFFVLLGMSRLVSPFLKRRWQQLRKKELQLESGHLQTAQLNEYPERLNMLIWVCSRAPYETGIFGLTLLGAFIFTLLPVLSYQVPDKEVFYLPSFFFLMAFAGLGLAWVLQFMEMHIPSVINIIGGSLIACSLPIYLLVHHYSPITDITQNNTLYQDRLARFQQLPQRAFILASNDGWATRYKYFQMVHHLRPDVTIETFGRLAPHFRGKIDLNPEAISADVFVRGLNISDRVNLLNGLLETYPDRDIYFVLDDSMPLELDHFRITRSTFDPYLLKIERKIPAENSAKSLPVVVGTKEDYFKEIRFVGFEIRGLDLGISNTFSPPLSFGGEQVDGLVRRGELFTLSFVVQRTENQGEKFFGEFAFANDRLEIPSNLGFTAAKTLEVIPEKLPNGWFHKDQIIFKIPTYIPEGLYTLVVQVFRAVSQAHGTYKGKKVNTTVPVQMTKAWKDQYEYQPLGRILVE